MNFVQAFKQMQEGQFVRRHGWKGYWFLDCNGKLIIKLADGAWITRGDLNETVENTLHDDWEVVEQHHVGGTTYDN